jgi:hypothetical protein
MKARINPILAAIGGLFALAAMLAAGQALAGGCGCVTPPACCSAPTPPQPPHYNCCQQPNINVNIPGVNVNVGASVIVNANVQAQANVLATGGAGGAVFVNGGGGGGGYLMPGAPGLIQGLNVDGGGLRRTAYEASRTKITRVVLEAVCLDDKDVPHPASQVTPDRDIEDSYDGELYRCIAGTRMQYTFAEYNGRVAFDHGQTVTCQKDDALYHTPGAPGSGGGAIECRRQKPARDCNERSLLRRFGAGVKILTLVTIEKYTAYREETTSATTTSSLSLDGGVGGVMN